MFFLASSICIIYILFVRLNRGFLDLNYREYAIFAKLKLYISTFTSPISVVTYLFVSVIR